MHTRFHGNVLQAMPETKERMFCKHIRSGGLGVGGGGGGGGGGCHLPQPVVHGLPGEFKIGTMQASNSGTVKMAWRGCDSFPNR